MKPNRKKLGWDFQVGTLIWIVVTLLWLFFPEFGQGSYLARADAFLCTHLVTARRCSGFPQQALNALSEAERSRPGLPLAGRVRLGRAPAAGRFEASGGA